MSGKELGKARTSNPIQPERPVQVSPTKVTEDTAEATAEHKEQRKSTRQAPLVLSKTSLLTLLAGAIVGLCVGFMLARGGTRQVEVTLLGQKLTLDDGQKEIVKGLQASIDQLNEEQKQVESKLQLLRKQSIDIAMIPKGLRATTPEATIARLTEAQQQLEQIDADVDLAVRQLDSYLRDHVLTTRLPVGENAVIDAHYARLAKVLFVIGGLQSASTFSAESLGRAVKEIQRKHSLDEDGTIGKRTWPKIVEAYKNAQQS